MASFVTRVVAAIVLAAISGTACLASDKNAAVNDRQLAALFFFDYGRSYGYQLMMARIQLETDRAELERDAIILQQKEELFRKNAIPQIELDVARLKDTWNRKQLIVSEKSVTYIAAEYEAMVQMGKHFAGVEIPAEALYATFRRGWDAGCDKGPDEVEAMKAWAEFLQKSVERSIQLNSQGNEPLSSVLEKKAQLRIAQVNYDQRNAALDKCRKVLFPSLEDILAIKR